MLKINHDTIEYNHTPVLQFIPGTQDFIRREVRDAIEFALINSEQIDDGEYIEAAEYNEMKRDKENYESSCQQTRGKLERLLDNLDKVIEDETIDARQALKDFADDLTSIQGDIEI